MTLYFEIKKREKTKTVEGWNDDEKQKRKRKSKVKVRV